MSPYHFQLSGWKRKCWQSLPYHYDTEVEHRDPTIKLFEVVQPLRGQGFGREMASIIERLMSVQDFPEIRITDIDLYPDSAGFWKKLGYQISCGEEGVKVLDPDDYDY